MDVLFSRPIEVILMVVGAFIIFFMLKKQDFPLVASIISAMFLFILAASTRAYIFPPSNQIKCENSRDEILIKYSGVIESNDRNDMHAWMGQANAWASICSTRADDVDIRFQNPTKFCKNNSSETIYFKEPMKIIKGIIEGEVL